MFAIFLGNYFYWIFKILSKLEELHSSLSSCLASPSLSCIQFLQLILPPVCISLIIFRPPPISIRSNNILVFSASCGVELGDLYVVTGGIENPNLPNNLKPLGIRKVGLYNDNGFVRNLPDLVMVRYNHACAGFKDINGDMVGVILFYS